MPKTKYTLRYYLLLVLLLIALFFSNDFGLVDIQKTAIVLAAGIDRDGAEFVVSTQIAVPQESDQGENVQAVLIESRGDTIAKAFDQINAKTGWYPKLAFCNLIILGSSATEKNVFECLDFFLRNEYMSDGCNLVAAEGKAKDLLNATTPIEKISSLAAEKVLSRQASSTGSAAVNTLRAFSIGYYGAGKSGYLPILTTQSPEDSPENIQDKQENPSQKESGSSSGGSGQSQKSGGGGQGGGESGKNGGGGSKEKHVFEAGETALFFDGVMVGKLNRKQTFALCAAKTKLDLSSYPLEHDGAAYSLQIKNSAPKLKFSIDKNARANLKIDVRLTAGIRDVSFSQKVPELLTGGALPEQLFPTAQKKLEEEILSVFETGRQCNCDVFGVLDRLQKFEPNYFNAFKDDLLDRIHPKISVSFSPLR